MILLASYQQFVFIEFFMQLEDNYYKMTSIIEDNLKTNEVFSGCFYAFVFSLIIGSFFTYFIHKVFRYHFYSTAVKRDWIDLENVENSRVKQEEIEIIPLLPATIGVIERFFFTILVAFYLPGVATAIITWMLIKMATGWNRIQKGETWRRMLSFQALLNSMFSLTFAVVAGLMANAQIPNESHILLIGISLLITFVILMLRIVYGEKIEKECPSLFIKKNHTSFNLRSRKYVTRLDVTD